MPETLTDIRSDEQRERVRTYFDGHRDWQGDYYSQGGAYFSNLLRRRKELIADTVSRLPRPAGGTALDIGCGSGVYTEELLRLGYATTGVDLSGEMIEACRRRFSGLSRVAPPLHLLVGDIEHLPFDDASFDLVLCIGVLGYLIDDERAVQELVRVTKPGGHVVVNVTNAYSLSDLDTRARAAVRALLSPRRAHPTTLPALPYAIRSAWMERTRNYTNKSYRLRRFEGFLGQHGLTLRQSFTFGCEFRLLRRFHLLPAAVLDALELALERVWRVLPLPYISRSGWGYVGVFTNRHPRRGRPD